MDEHGSILDNPSPYAKANVLSRLLFWWLGPILTKGYRKTLGEQDFFRPPKNESASVLCQKLQNQWERQLRKETETGKKPSLRRALRRMFRTKLLVCGIIFFCKFYVLGIINVVCLGRIVRMIEEGVTQGPEIYAYVAAVIGTFGLGVIAFQKIAYIIERVGMRIRVACCTLIYRKALKLSKALMANTTSGKFFNVVAGDVLRFDLLSIYIVSVWIDPISAVLVTAYLYPKYGPAVLPGILILCLYAVFMVVEGKLFKKLRMIKSTATDERLKITNGILSDMKAIKMYGWELPFASLINNVRRRELKVMAATLALKTLNMVVYISGSKFPLLLTIMTVVLNGGEVRAEMVFVTYSMFNLLKLNLLFVFPNAIQKIAEALVSVNRLQDMLLLEEKKQNENVRHLPVSIDRIPRITINNLTMTWGEDDSRFKLNGISLALSNSDLCFITGPVGSGKSSVLMALLGEMLLKSGDVTVNGRIAFVAQEAWLFPASIRKNILFSQPFDESRYRQVLEACALIEDLNTFPDGDAAHVGDKGVTLSGGQKARIHLARAIYHNADVYLMDDCLSAVDARVGNHLFHSCLNGLVSKSLRVLVTHQIQYITPESYLVVMNNGNIAKQGIYSNFTNQENKEKSEDSEKTLDILAKGTFSIDDMDLRDIPIDTDDSQILPRSQNSLEETYRKEVSLKAYTNYLNSAYTISTMFLFIVINLVALSSEIGYELWLSTWTNAEAKADQQRRFLANSTNETYYVNATHSEDFVPNVTLHIFDYNFSSTWDAFIIFVYITMSLLMATLIRTAMFYAFTVKASTVIHKGLVNAVLKSKMGFFNLNPLGRIINRFSKDMEAIDDVLPAAMYDEIVEISTLLEVIIIAIYINYWLAIPTVVLGIAFGLVCVCYWRTASVIKRIEAVKRSPVFTLMSNSIQGQVTIRAHKAEDVLSKEFDSHQDVHSSAWFLFLSMSRWLSSSIESLLLIFITIILSTLVVSSEKFTGSEIGLLVTLVTRLSSSLQWGIKQAAEVETQITSVERIQEYSQLPSEDGYDTEMPKNLPKDWPKYGKINFNNVSLSYSANGPLVLKSLNFTITPGEKVGIVGRTGAGKSSIITALFRLSDTQGDIHIDGINSAAVPLPTLRRAFSIIPQDPVLFVGSIRYNLDPFSEYSDNVLWQALEEVQIKDTIQKMEKGLDSVVAEGGSNFSVGQRQLLCLARAILRKSKIILLDEATSNVDKTSDEIVQTVLKKRFNNCTILIIAHRLDTIMDVDRVMVMHEGQLIEFDEPFTLLQREETAFCKLVKQTGKIASSRLMEIAQMHHLYVRSLSKDGTQKNA